MDEKRYSGNVGYFYVACRRWMGNVKNVHAYLELGAILSNIYYDFCHATDTIHRVWTDVHRSGRSAVLYLGGAISSRKHFGAICKNDDE